MSFEYVFDNPSSFLKTIDVLKDLVDVINFEFRNDGIYFQTMDPCLVSLSICSFHKGYFSSIQHSKHCEKGIHLKIFHLCMKCFQPTDTMSFLEGENGELEIKIHRPSNEVYFFKVPTVAMEVQRLQIPEDEIYESEFHMSSVELSDHVKNMSSFGPNITFSVKDKLIDMKSVDITGTLQISKVFGRSSIVTRRNISATFSTKYLLKLTKGVSIAKEVSVWLSEEKPLCLHFIPNEHCNVKFFLAPRYEEEC